VDFGAKEKPFAAGASLDGPSVQLDDIKAQGACGLTADRESKAIKRDSTRTGSGQRSARAQDAHVSDALRNAYEQAVNEDVPQEFIDLLGKLA
jgi:hypothetical protein